MGETANTTPTLRERVAALAVAADNAPSFGGLRQHLTQAADFAVAVVDRLESGEQAGSVFADRISDYDAAIKMMTEHQTALNAALQGVIKTQAGLRDDFAELLAKLGEIEARLPEA